MGKTPEVTARSRNCGSGLKRTPGGRSLQRTRRGSRDRVTPVSPAAEIGLQTGSPGEVLGRTACEWAEASGKRSECRARIRAAAAGPSIGLGGRFRGRGRVRRSDGALPEGAGSVPGGWSPTPRRKAECRGARALLESEMLARAVSAPGLGEPTGPEHERPGSPGFRGRPTRLPRPHGPARLPKRRRRHSG